jgi:hypothetical protein
VHTFNMTFSLTGDTISAGLVPGSGPGLVRSDCYVELKVLGIDNPGPDVRGGRVVTCTDGDPCDTDGECGNGSCTLSVAVCIDQTDPNLAACHPPTGLRKLFVSPKLAGAVPASLDGSACGSFIPLTLPLHDGTHNGKRTAMVRLSANATAPNGTNPLRDRDTFVLECLPRTTPCPTTSTTTTTSTTRTMPTTTTTTTTAPSTTTTLATTTTTTSSTTTTTVVSPSGAFLEDTSDSAD